MTTLVAGERERAARRAGQLGLAWGLGHAATLFAFGLPIILFNSVLPLRVQQAAESTIGFVIVYLALRLLVRWRRGELDLHAHPHAHGARTPRGAFAIGLVHGMGGSAGVGVLLLAAIHDRLVAAAALAVFAACTALSMALLSTGVGLTLSSGAAGRSLPLSAGNSDCSRGMLASWSGRPM